ncbi:hypothetical protein HDU99_001313 [Rhizoclosmatium hyalinum]|nr:hypothetical protein HDU99_001313 [Rhizoclosmatium hyalinum]
MWRNQRRIENLEKKLQCRKCFDEGKSNTNSLCEHRLIRVKCKTCTPVRHEPKTYRPRVKFDFLDERDLLPSNGLDGKPTNTKRSASVTSNQSGKSGNEEDDTASSSAPTVPACLKCGKVKRVTLYGFEKRPLCKACHKVLQLAVTNTKNGTASPKPSGPNSSAAVSPTSATSATSTASSSSTTPATAQPATRQNTAISASTISRLKQSSAAKQILRRLNNDLSATTSATVTTTATTHIKPPSSIVTPTLSSSPTIRPSTPEGQPPHTIPSLALDPTPDSSSTASTAELDSRSESPVLPTTTSTTTAKTSLPTKPLQAQLPPVHIIFPTPDATPHRDLPRTVIPHPTETQHCCTQCGSYFHSGRGGGSEVCTRCDGGLPKREDLSTEDEASDASTVSVGRGSVSGTSPGHARKGKGGRVSGGGAKKRVRRGSGVVEKGDLESGVFLFDEVTGEYVPSDVDEIEEEEEDEVTAVTVAVHSGEISGGGLVEEKGRVDVLAAAAVAVMEMEGAGDVLRKEEVGVAVSVESFKDQFRDDGDAAEILAGLGMSAF